MSDASCWYYSIDVHEVCHVALHLNVRSCIIGVTTRYLSMVTRVLPTCFAYLTLFLQAVHNFFKQYSPLPKLGTSTVTGSGVSDYGGKPMSVIKVSYEGRRQKRKRDDNGGRGGGGGDKSVGRGGGRGGRGPKEGPSKEWPGGTKKYCKFALAKTNMDTQVECVLHCIPVCACLSGDCSHRCLHYASVAHNHWLPLSTKLVYCSSYVIINSAKTRLSTQYKQHWQA